MIKKIKYWMTPNTHIYMKRGSPSQNLGIAKHPCTRTVTHKMEVTASRAIKLAILG